MGVEGGRGVGSWNGGWSGQGVGKGAVGGNGKGHGVWGMGMSSVCPNQCMGAAVPNPPSLVAGAGVGRAAEWRGAGRWGWVGWWGVKAGGGWGVVGN